MCGIAPTSAGGGAIVALPGARARRNVDEATIRPPALHACPRIPGAHARSGVPRVARWLALGLCLTVAPAVHAADAPAAVAVPMAAAAASAAEFAAGGPLPPGGRIELAESTRSSLRSTTEWLARGVDSWFGRQPFEEGGKVTDGRMSVGVLHRQDTGSDYAVRFNVHLRLPNAEKFAYVFIGRDDPRDIVTDTPDAFSKRQRLLGDRAEAPSTVAGLGVSLPNSVDARIGFRGGLKPYAQARYEKSWAGPADTVMDFRETLFWARADRFGATTALSIERPLSPSLALRWLTATTITQAAPKFDTSSSLGAYQDMGEQRLLSFEALAHAIQGSGVGLSDYGLQVKWEQPIYRNWLLAELLAGHFWPRPDAANPRGRAWAVGGTLKMRF